jgi:DNA-binding CsgD family transcriptional regulator
VGEKREGVECLVAYSSDMAKDEGLRPRERRIRQLVADGCSDAEIASRFRRSPEYIRRVISMSELDGRDAQPDGSSLRPIERRILRWRDAGAEPSDIATRFRRSPGFVRRVEDLARYKLSR